MRRAARLRGRRRNTTMRHRRRRRLNNRRTTSRTAADDDRQPSEMETREMGRKRRPQEAGGDGGRPTPSSRKRSRRPSTPAGSRDEPRAAEVRLPPAANLRTPPFPSGRCRLRTCCARAARRPVQAAAAAAIDAGPRSRAADRPATPQFRWLDDTLRAGGRLCRTGGLRRHHDVVVARRSRVDQARQRGVPSQ